MVIPPALKSRPFLLYWLGHLISIAGSHMQLWALYWHLRTLSDQPMVISGVGLMRFLPVVLLSLIAGVAADRFNRRKDPSDIDSLQRRLREYTLAGSAECRRYQFERFEI